MNPTQKPDVIFIGFDEIALYLAEISPADVLRCAAVYVRIHGWHRGDLYANDNAQLAELLTTPAACAYGAIGMACFGRPIPTRRNAAPDWCWRLYDRARAALDDYVTDTHPTVTYDHDGETFNDTYGDDWNDHHGRTAAEVVDVLDATAFFYDATHTPAGGAR